MKQRQNKIHNYIRRIKNPESQRYAKMYLVYKLGGQYPDDIPWDLNDLRIKNIENHIDQLWKEEREGRERAY